MRTRIFPAALFVFCIVLGTGSAWAEIVRGRWEKVELLKPGTGIIIRLKAGDRIDGSYRGIGTDEVRISDLTGAAVRLPKSAIQSIETAEEVTDRLRNGTLIGAGAGFAVGFVSMIGVAKAVTASGPIWGEDGTAFILAGGLAGSGIGAIIGALIDSRVTRPELLYLSTGDGPR